MTVLLVFTKLYYNKINIICTIFLQLNILPIDKLIQDRIGLFMYKMFHGLRGCNLYIKNCDVHNHNTIDIEIIFMFLWHIVTCMPKVFIVQVS